MKIDFQGEPQDYHGHHQLQGFFRSLLITSSSSYTRHVRLGEVVVADLSGGKKMPVLCEILYIFERVLSGCRRRLVTFRIYFPYNRIKSKLLSNIANVSENSFEYVKRNDVLTVTVEKFGECLYLGETCGNELYKKSFCLPVDIISASTYLAMKSKDEVRPEENGTKESVSSEEQRVAAVPKETTLENSSKTPSFPRFQLITKNQFARILSLICQKKSGLLDIPSGPREVLPCTEWIGLKDELLAGTRLVFVTRTSNSSGWSVNKMDKSFAQPKFRRCTDQETKKMTIKWVRDPRDVPEIPHSTVTTRLTTGSLKPPIYNPKKMYRNQALRKEVRPRGRPRSALVIGELSGSVARKARNGDKARLLNPNAVKRPVGRPRKNEGASSTSSGDQEWSNQSAPVVVKRGPGRPRKRPIEESNLPVTNGVEEKQIKLETDAGQVMQRDLAIPFSVPMLKAGTMTAPHYHSDQRNGRQPPLTFPTRDLVVNGDRRPSVEGTVFQSPSNRSFTFKEKAEPVTRAHVQVMEPVYRTAGQTDVLLSPKRESGYKKPSLWKPWATEDDRYLCQCRPSCVLAEQCIWRPKCGYRYPPAPDIANYYSDVPPSIQPTSVIKPPNPPRLPVSQTVNLSSQPQLISSDFTSFGPSPTSQRLPSHLSHPYPEIHQNYSMGQVKCSQDTQTAPALRTPVQSLPSPFLLQQPSTTPFMNSSPYPSSTYLPQVPNSLGYLYPSQQYSFLSSPSLGNTYRQNGSGHMHLSPQQPATIGLPYSYWKL